MSKDVQIGSVWTRVCTGEHCHHQPALNYGRSVVITERLPDCQRVSAGYVWFRYQGLGAQGRSVCLHPKRFLACFKPVVQADKEYPVSRFDLIEIGV